MTLSLEQKNILKSSAENYPFPIAYACQQYVVESPQDPWRSWELLSRNILQSVLQYMSHLLLSDLIAMGEKPPHLFHHIQGILSRPFAGHYVGFLRETALHYEKQGLGSALPELVDFIAEAEIHCTKLEQRNGLIAQLVEYRNAFAHGKVVNQANIEKTAQTVLELTLFLLQEIQFLTRYPLHMEDGRELMGHSPPGLDRQAKPLLAVSAQATVLRPLLLKLSGSDLALLEDVDITKPRMVYRGAKTYHSFTKKQLKKGDPALILEALKESLARVRSTEALLPRPNWDDFVQRADLISQRTDYEYGIGHKYDSKLYVPSPEWEGENGRLTRFLNSDKSLLAISGHQGTGKSALVAHMARACREKGHAVLFINAQRLTYADVKWSENPVPGFLENQLHYAAGLDTKGMQRLAKQAPPEKKIIIFFDAINEVDSIKNKWNPFRALEEILNWCCPASHPNLKFILSFRLDLYETYEYLKPDTLPANIQAISFQGSNTNHPWVHDLEPFNDSQAKALYKKLQNLPDRCMAPAMDWAYLQEQMGDQFKQYIENPLLFAIFLQAHHQSDKILCRDQESLFLTYADQLTGRMESSARPWWRKVWEFIKNGNITPKEMFLVDCVQRMAKNGSAAFLVDQLNPRNKQDRRILNFLSKRPEKDLTDLREGRLLTLENIEVRRKNTETATRRVSFTGELMATALDGIAPRLEKLKKFRFGVAGTLASFTLTALLLTVIRKSLFKFGLTLGTIDWGGLTDRHIKTKTFVLEQLISPTSFAQIVNPITVLSVFVFIVIVSVICDFFTKVHTKNSGLLNYGCDHEFSTTSIKNINKIATILLFPFIFSSVFGLDFLGLGLFDFSINFLVIICLPPLSFLFYFLTPSGWAKFTNTSNFSIPFLVFKNYAKGQKTYWESGFAKSVSSFNFRITFIVYTVYALLIIFLLIIYTPPLIKNTSLSLSLIELEWFKGLMTYPYGYSYYLNRHALNIKICITLTIFLALFAILGCCYTESTKINSKRYKIILSVISVFPHKKSIYQYIIPYYIFFILLTFLYFWVDHFQPFDKLFQTEKPTNNTIVSKPHNFPIIQDGKLDLQGHHLTSEEIQFIAHNPHIKTLILPDQKDLAIDLQHLSISQLYGRPDSFVNLSHVRPEKIQEALLVLYNPEDWLRSLPEDDIYAFNQVGIQGSVSDLSGLRAFPWLQTVSIDEEYAAAAIPTMPTLWNNLELIVNSENHPKLDWMTPETASYIITLKQSPTRFTQNLELLERVILNGDQLDLTILQRLKTAKTIIIEISFPKERSWYLHLQNLLKNELNQLRVFGLSMGSAKQGNAPLDFLRIKKGFFLEDTPEEFANHRIESCLNGEINECAWNETYYFLQQFIDEQMKSRFGKLPDNLQDKIDGADVHTLLKLRDIIQGPEIEIENKLIEALEKY